MDIKVSALCIEPHCIYKVATQKMNPFHKEKVAIQASTVILTYLILGVKR